MDSCQTCKYQHDVQNQLFCRRNPPVAVLLPQGQQASIIAPVQTDGWCGEFAQATVVTVRKMPRALAEFDRKN